MHLLMYVCLIHSPTLDYAKTTDGSQFTYFKFNFICVVRNWIFRALTKSIRRHCMRTEPLPNCNMPTKWLTLVLFLNLGKSVILTILQQSLSQSILRIYHWQHCNKRKASQCHSHSSTNSRPYCASLRHFI